MYYGLYSDRYNGKHRNPGDGHKSNKRTYARVRGRGKPHPKQTVAELERAAMAGESGGECGDV